MRLHLEWIQAHHFTPEGDPDGPLVFNDDDALAYVMERAAVTELPISVEHAREVIDAHLAYFQFMGAVHIEDPEFVQQDLAELGLTEIGSGDDRAQLETPPAAGGVNRPDDTDLGETGR